MSSLSGYLSGRRILCILTGSVAVCKSLELLRRLQEQGAVLRVVMTRGACQFVTPLAVGALTGERVHTDLFDSATEFDVGHIRLARDTDAVLLIPATANILAKLSYGLADDLASAILLATRAPIFAVPAMNPALWTHPATQENIDRLHQRGIVFLGPVEGEMAERGEAGIGRLAPLEEILERLTAFFSSPSPSHGSYEDESFSEGGVPFAEILKGKRILITSGPTQESIDAVRYLSNHSSGRQGHALAKSLQEAGAQVTLITGPVHLPDPPHLTCFHVTTAQEMMAEVERNLPVDVAIFAAAVSDWRPETVFQGKFKKDAHQTPPLLRLVPNPDILASVARHPLHRPPLVIGFAAETEDLLLYAQKKLEQKGADWILANTITISLGGTHTTLFLVTREGIVPWPCLPKEQVGCRLAPLIARKLGKG